MEVSREFFCDGVKVRAMRYRECRVLDECQGGWVSACFCGVEEHIIQWCAGGAQLNDAHVTRQDRAAQEGVEPFIGEAEPEGGLLIRDCSAKAAVEDDGHPEFGEHLSRGLRQDEPKVAYTAEGHADLFGQRHDGCQEDGVLAGARSGQLIVRPVAIFGRGECPGAELCCGVWSESIIVDVDGAQGGRAVLERQGGVGLWYHGVELDADAADCVPFIGAGQTDC